MLVIESIVFPSQISGRRERTVSKSALVPRRMRTSKIGEHKPTSEICHPEPSDELFHIKHPPRNFVRYKTSNSPFKSNNKPWPTTATRPRVTHPTTVLAFLAMPPRERTFFIQKANRCFVCLSSHLRADCRSDKKCSICPVQMFSSS